MFSKDLEFLEKNTEVITLKMGNGAVVVAPAYQGRVMTSTVNNVSGDSFGWINRPVIEKGFMSDEEKKREIRRSYLYFWRRRTFLVGARRRSICTLF